MVVELEKSAKHRKGSVQRCPATPKTELDVRSQVAPNHISKRCICQVQLQQLLPIIVSRMVVSKRFTSACIRVVHGRTKKVSPQVQSESGKQINVFDHVRKSSAEINFQNLKPSI